MKRKEITFRQLLRSINIVGRGVAVRDDDVFIVSYPKSGSTWLRYMISNVILEDCNYSDMESIIFDIYKTKGFRLPSTGRRIFKSHEYMDPRYNKVIYLVRDPKSVVVSYYYYKRRLGAINAGDTIHKFVKEFVYGELDNFGSWGDNVGSWLGAREMSDNFLLIRYEDIHINPELCLRTCLEFIGISADDYIIEKAVEMGQSKNMSIAEEEDIDWIEGRLASEKNIKFVRDAKASNWGSDLSRKDVKLIDDSWPKLIRKLGYNSGEI